MILNVAITLNSFKVVEDFQSIYTDLILCINWTDYRLQSLNLSASSVEGMNDDLHLTQVILTSFKSLWLPSVYFRNAISAKVVNTINNIEYVRIWPEQKRLQYCTRMSVQFLCRMTFSNFPFDEQYCNFQLESCK